LPRVIKDTQKPCARRRARGGARVMRVRVGA